MARGFYLLTALVIGLVAANCGSDGTQDPVISGDGLAAPDWVHVAATGPDKVTLRWDDITSTEQGFLIERATSIEGSYTAVDTVDQDMEEFEDETVSAGIIYYYRIRSLDAVGRMGDVSDPIVWAETVENQTPEVPIAINPPNNSGGYEGAMTLEWSGSDPDGDEITYEIHFGDSRVNLIDMGNDPSATTYAVAEQLQLTYFYFWRIVARDPHGAMALSPIWNFGTRIERVEVPAGYFFQGDFGLFYEEDTVTFNYPNNPVYVEDFEIDKYEVSNQQFTQFLQFLLDGLWVTVEEGQVLSIVNDTIYAEVYPLGDENSGITFNPDQGELGTFVPRPGKENHPVIEVSWYGARRFAEYNGRRLPWEAEWEKAARGTTTITGDSLFTVDDVDVTVGFGYPYPWGTVGTANHYNYAGSDDPYETSVGVATTPVGFFDGDTEGGFSTIDNASFYNCYDLSGNVAEWCEDTYLPYNSGSNEHMKVIKGGAWRFQDYVAQTFWRQEMFPDSTDNAIGFRTVKSITAP
jgi:formylglycine-generating enzyme required for sulfatase activity